LREPKTLPSLLGRSNNLAGPSGLWVGRSGKCFAMELYD